MKSSHRDARPTAAKARDTRETTDPRQRAKDLEHAQKKEKESQRQKEKEERERAKRRFESGIDLIKPRPGPDGREKELWKMPSSASTEFICKIKFWNRLPEIPFEPKLLQYPRDPLHFIRYQPTSLERQHQWELQCEPNLGIPIDLIDPNTYTISDPANPVELPDEDRQLCKPRSTQEKKSSIAAGGHEKTYNDHQAPWLLKTKYMTNDLFDAANKFKLSDQQVEMQGHASSARVKKAAEQMRQGTPLQEQIAKIERGFKIASEPPKHPTNKALTVTEVLEVLPDREFFRNRYVQINFDTEPINPLDVKSKKTEAPYAQSDEHRLSLMHQAMVRITNTTEPDKSDAPHPDDVLDYFVPDDRPLAERRKRKADSAVDELGDGAEFCWLREYVHGTATGTDGYKLPSTYLFSRRDGKMLYNSLPLHYILKKQKATGTKTADQKRSKKFSTVRVEPREHTEGEKKAIKEKEAALQL